jgi:NOL1/NOP2/sun family putative RNA methylase
MMVLFKPAFIERYSKMVPDFEEFMEYTKMKLRKSIRVNTLKTSPEQLINILRGRGWKIERMPWYEYGYYVDTLETVGKTMEHSLGYFYVQEAASMLPPIDLEPKKDDIILDMAAAPGSKTTQMGMMMENTGVIVANDVRMDKIQALATNVQRCGLLNIIITKMDGRRFSKHPEGFDKVLLDAPCSGTGAIRKSWRILEMWNPKGVTRISRNQKGLIMAAYNALKPGGTLVYSTCTLEPEENEGVVDFLLQKTGAKIEKTNIKKMKTRPGIEEFEGQQYCSEVKKAVRIYPQDNDTEGFFIAKVRKND